MSERVVRITVTVDFPVDMAFWGRMGYSSPDEVAAHYLNSYADNPWELVNDDRAVLKTEVLHEA